jgi:predicted dehydrogenase
MAEHSEVDLVVVAVKTLMHKELVAAALNARKHVYCEWPLGVTTDEARQMFEDARRAGVVHMIGLQASGNEGLNYIKDLVADGFVGRVVSATLLVSELFYGPAQEKELAYVADVRNGTNLLHTATPHSLEALSYCLGEFTEISAFTSVQYPTMTVSETGEVLPKTSPDQVMVQGVLSNGAVASFHIKGGATRTTGVYFEVNGTGGDLVATSQGYANIQRANLRIRGGTAGATELHEMSLPEKYRLQPAGLPEGPPVAVAHQYQQLAHALRVGAPVACDFSYAVRRHELIDAIRQSAQTGKRQRLSS